MAGLLQPVPILSRDPARDIPYLRASMEGMILVRSSLELRNSPTGCDIKRDHSVAVILAASAMTEQYVWRLPETSCCVK